MKKNKLSMKSNLCFLGAALISVAASSASAGEVGKFYVVGDAGYDLSHGKVKLESQKYIPSGSATGPSVKDGSVVKGESTQSKNFSGLRVSGGLGYNVSDELRTDIVLDYKFKQKQKFDFPAGAALDPEDGSQSAEITNNEISNKSWIIMANLYYDINNTSDWTPFFNVGVGYGSSDNSPPADKKKNVSSKKGFAWNVGAGVGYKLSSDMYVDIVYRLTGMSKQSDYKDNEKINANEGTATIKEKFPDLSHFFGVRFRFEF